MAYIVRGNRKTSYVLINQSMRYVRNKATKTTLYWRCWRNGCKASVTTNVFDVTNDNPHIHIRSVSEHAHADDDAAMIRAESARHRMKNRVRNDPSRPIRRAYESVVADVSRSRRRTVTLPEFHKVRSALSRAKKELVPNIPTTADDVTIEGVWAETWSSEPFLLHQDNYWGIVIFSTDENIEMPGRCTDVYIDGTFRTTPHPYTQYVTVHGKLGDSVMCLASCLLTGKTTAQYRKLIQCLRTNVRRVTHHRRQPQTVICDLEQALIIALQTEFPRTRIRGCYFHFTQNLYRHINELGLSRPYRRDYHFQRFIQKLLSLGYLPLPVVRQNFTLLTNSQTAQPLFQQYPELHEFVDYIESTYFNGPFVPAMWNCFSRNRHTTSNNYVEGDFMLIIVTCNICS